MARDPRSQKLDRLTPQSQWELLTKYFFIFYGIRVERYFFMSLLAVSPSQMSSRINELRSLELGISEMITWGNFWCSFFKSICQSLWFSLGKVLAEIWKTNWVVGINKKNLMGGSKR